MHYIHLILISDFTHVLYSAMKFYTNKKYLPKHKLFYTIYLLQEKTLNPTNYSEQEIIMQISYELLTMI
jgi:hypothetical protein